MNLTKKFDKLKVGNNDFLIEGIQDEVTNTNNYLSTSGAIYNHVNTETEAVIKSVNYAVPTNGYYNSNLLSQSLERGTTVLTIDFDVKEAFSGTSDANWGLSLSSGEILLDINDVDLDTIGVYRKELITILSEDATIIANFNFTGTTGAAILRFQYAKRTYTNVNSGDTIYTSSYMPTMFVRYNGDENTFATIVLSGTNFLFGNTGGSFIFDIGGAYETILTGVTETVEILIGSVNYVITFLGYGSLLFSYDYIPIIYTERLASFGDNTYGQLGLEDTVDYNGAIKYPSIIEYVKVSSSDNFTVVLLSNGTIISFGNNTYGQLGMNNTTDYSSTICHPSFTGVTDISCGFSRTMLLFENGTIASFGRNDHGMLGIGNTGDTLGVIQYPAFTGVTAISSGAESFSFLLLTGGTIVSFGDNTFGQLGMGNKTDYNGAIQYPSFTGVTKIYSGSYETIILFENNTIATFGSNLFGQLGMNNKTDYNGAIQYPSFTGVTDITIGFHALLLLTGGTIVSFGANNYGQLGIGNTGDTLGVIQYPAFTGITNIYTGAFCSIILFENGTIATFGINDYGQLGMGNKTDYNGAIQYPNITRIESVYNFYSSVFLKFEDIT